MVRCVCGEGYVMRVGCGCAVYAQSLGSVLKSQLPLFLRTLKNNAVNGVWSCTSHMVCGHVQVTCVNIT